MRRYLPLSASAAFVTFLCAPLALAATLEVGPGKTYAKPCAAIAAAQDGDTILIDASGDYHGDICQMSHNGLTLKGMNGRPKIDATGVNIPNGKAIWVIQGNDTTVENIEFSGASVSDANGAGIRQEGANLTVRGCYFHDNQDGILAGDNMASEILIETSEFAHNGAGDGQSHNMYINHVKKFTLQYSYSHGANAGHLVKSRCSETHIQYNRLSDDESTNVSYEINLPEGGTAYVIGNLIEQGADPNGEENGAIIDYASESIQSVSHLFVVNNTVLNNRTQGGTFVKVNSGVTTPAVVRNNIFAGGGTVCSQASAVLDHNFTMGDSKLVDPTNIDFHLQAGSPCVDMGADPGMGDGQDLTPTFQYVHPASYQTRTTVGAIDIGAYELNGGGGMGGTGGSAATSSSGGTGATGGNSGAGGSGAAGGAGGESGVGGGGTGGGGTGGGSVGMKSGCSVGGGEGEGGVAIAALAMAAAVAVRRRRRAA